MDILVFNKGKRIKGNLNRLKQIDDNDRNLYYLFSSILNVDYNYVDTDVAHKRLERVFAYELYHQWSKQIDEMNKQYNNTTDYYLLNGETVKDMSHFRIDCSNVNTFPDMILHKSMDRPIGQAIVCEIKRTSNFSDNGFEDDIKKLRQFVCEQQNDYTFNFGVFVLVGNKIKAVLEKMDSLNWTIRRRKIKSDKIMLVAYDGNQLEAVSLYNALDKKERKKYIAAQI